MNSKKGKGKPRPNKSNPNPSQKEEQTEVEKIENVLEEIKESVQKSEERVPEIISEVMIPPVAESKEKEEDSPKKPKRNRGKKKKNEKDDGDMPESQPSESAEDVQFEIIEMESQEIIAEENVTPSARKKKNKNKKGADVEPKITEKVDKEIALEEKNPDVSDNIEKEEPKPQEAGNQETKALKKKNKKKKRNDSERSDAKAEEISCISAFQKLLKDDKSDSEQISKDVTSSEITKNEELKISTFIQEMGKMDDVKEIPMDITKESTSESGGKSKRKNKKDKKEPLKEIQPDFSLVTAIKPITRESPVVITDEISLKDIERVPQLSPEEMCVPKNDEDTKPKAKIAKPVERKRKGKGDKNTEGHSETESLEQETETEGVTTLKPMEVKSKTDTPKESTLIPEISKDESKIVEPHTAEKKDEQNIPKPKKKGKANKHVEETLEKREHEENKSLEIPIQPPTEETSGAPELIVREEPIVTETSYIEENKQTTPKPNEKKKKGKGNKQSQEPSETIESKGIVIKEQSTPVELLETLHEATPVASIAEKKIEQEKQILPKTLEEVIGKEHKEEIIKPTERKKGKKEKKNQQSALEAPEEFKVKDKTPEPMQGDITTAPEEKLEKRDSLVEPKELITIQSEQIIQPVEKKREKSKKDIFTPELTDIKGQGQELIIIDEIKPMATSESTEIINKPNQSKSLKDLPLMPEPMESIQTKQEVSSDIETKTLGTEIEEMKDTSLINLPEIPMGKKRKKSPKPPKHDQKHKIPESKPEILTETSETEKIGTQSSMKDAEKIEPIPLLPTEELPEPKIEEESKPIKIIETTSEVIQEAEDKTPFETKTKKKRKKSPKLPLELPTASDVSDDSALKGSEKDTSAEQSDKLKDIVQGSETKGEIFSDLPSDIEIKSLKGDDSEGSACGFTPDVIQYPRATSQDLIDNNNNMMIHEITAAEEVKLQIPTIIPDTPLIQGSGSTPLETPENILVGIRISQADIATCKNEPEKTDLKSKMMEVNQDMEELRLSIERSLAELTSIEKSESTVEKQFEDKKRVVEEPKSTEIKISMPSELVAKIQPEKIESLDKKEKTAVSPGVGNKLVGTTIPPKTSMFFDKELKDTGADSKPVRLESILDDTTQSKEPVRDISMPPVPPMRKDKSASKERDNKDNAKPEDIKPNQASSTGTPKAEENITDVSVPPVPARKDNKNKSKNKKKGKQEPTQTVTQPESSTTAAASRDPPKDSKKEEKTDKTSGTSQEKGKQQAGALDDGDKGPIVQDESKTIPSSFDPIENFEDAMTSSADDINRTFEMIADEASRSIQGSHVNPEIKIIAPVEDTKRDRRDEKINPVSQPKNLLGHPDIPVRLNKTDYKKEKNKTPNAVLAKVKIKDSVEIEAKKQTKDTQTDNIRKFMKNKSIDESFSSMTIENDEFVYKYSFRKVFLQSNCHVCKKELKQARVPCNYCNLLFYCSAKHKDEDWPQHQGLCFAISTIVHLKDQKHIYADAKDITGQNYRLLRMQMIVSCERVLKRKLAAWEQEALLYPRICADVSCREWRQNKLVDCDGCGQISYCADNPNHFPKSHQCWCKSYALYQKLVCYQQTKGRVEPKLPTKVMEDHYQIPETINEVLASMYEEKIDMNDIQYAALTQIATAPLTAAYYHQMYASASQANGTYKKPSCTVHIVEAELQFEADALNKWEVFFLHLRPQLQELRVVMIGADLNPSNLPLELIGKVKVCENCRMKKRRVLFNFHDKTTYHDYCASDEFVTPDLVCAFNPNIKRCAMYNGKDHWPKTIACIVKQKAPFLVTSGSLATLERDVARARSCGAALQASPARRSALASVRADRNFVSDDDAPLLFHNHAAALLAAR